MSTASSPLTATPSSFFSPYNRPSLPPLSTAQNSHFQSSIPFVQPHHHPPTHPTHHHYSHQQPYEPSHLQAPQRPLPQPQHLPQHHHQPLHHQMTVHHQHHPHPYNHHTSSVSPGSEVPGPLLSPPGSVLAPAPPGAVYTGPHGESRRKTPSSWDPHDDLLLRHLKEQLKLGWKEIAAYFPNRTTNACQFRWRRLVSGTLRSAGGGAPLSPDTNSPPSGGEFDRRSSSIISINPLQNYQASYEQNPNFYQPTQQPPTSNPTWTKDQDELLRSRQDLRPEELSLLLGVSEQEIKLRLGQLEKPVSATSSPATTGNSTPSSAATATSSVSSAPKSLANYQLSTPTSAESSDNVTIVDNEQEVDSGNEDGVPRTLAGRSRAGSHPRPLLPRKLSGSHFDGLKLPVPVLQRPASFSEGSPSSTAAATPTVTPSTPATPVGGYYGSGQ